MTKYIFKQPEDLMPLGTREIKEVMVGMNGVASIFTMDNEDMEELQKVLSRVIEKNGHYSEYAEIPYSNAHEFLSEYKARLKSETK